jgi:hypothetical protein
VIPWALIPWRLVGAVALAAAVAGLAFKVLHDEREKGRAEVRAEYAQTEQEARSEFERLRFQAEHRQKEIYDDYRNQAAVESARSAAARSELERVRNAAHAIGRPAPPGEATVACRADDAGTLRGLLVEGAELVEEGRRRLGSASAKVAALQAAAASAPE